MPRSEEYRQAFMTIGSIGWLNEKGKTVLSYSFKGKGVSDPDFFLTTFAVRTINTLLGCIAHSSFETAEKDLAELKKQIADMKLLPNPSDIEDMAIQEAAKPKPKKTKSKR